MDAERWRRVEALFQRAADLPPRERVALLDRECAGDAELRGQVERLLARDATPSDLLDDPAALLDVGGRDPLVGRRLGAWRLTSRLAVGGMGVVYRAERADGLFEQEAAVKVLRFDASTPEMVRRFELERLTVARLSHPNIARLQDGGTTEHGQPYLVMELIRGAPIDRACDERRLPVSERLRLFAAVCRGVHFAHQNLVVHRDLKPANVLVDEHGVPKLLDFGIARLLDERDLAAGDATQTFARILTPEYASPEQLAGEPVTTATDVYSLGVILYGLLTGRKPLRHESRSPLEWHRIVSERTPTRPSTAVLRQDGAAELPPEALARARATTPNRLRQLLAGDLDRIVLMALRKEPERRYASAQALAEDIQRHLEGRPVHARGDSFAYVAGRFVLRNRVAVGAAALVLLALVAGTAAALRGQAIAREQAEHARIEAMSFQSIAAFLMDTFLRTDLLGQEQRAAALDNVLRQAERVRREHAQDRHLRANLLDALGRVCLSLDLAPPARELMEEALALRLAEFGERSIEVALSHGSLGLLAYEQGELEEAERTLRRALALHRSIPGTTHTDVALAANDLAVVLRNRGALDEAEALHREALALRRSENDDSLAVAESLNNLSGVHLDRGEVREARALLEEALAIRTAILGDQHGLTAQSLSNLANTAFRVGESAEARELLVRAEASFRALHSEGLAGLASVLRNLAAMDLHAGDHEAAEGRLREALEIQTGRLSPEHADVASIQGLRALLAQRRGDTDGARALWDDVVRIRRASFGEASPVLGRTLQEHGAFLLGTGDASAAEAALRESVAILRASGVDPAVLGRSQVYLAIALQRQDELDEALEHMRAGIPLLESDPHASELELTTARQHLDALQQARTSTGG